MEAAQVLLDLTDTTSTCLPTTEVSDVEEAISGRQEALGYKQT